MKAHSEQHLDDLAKKVMTSAPLETPSFNFTADVMAKLDAPQVSAITTYKPLISKKAWIVIGIIMRDMKIKWFFSINWLLVE